MRTFSKLFGRSPFMPLLTHMERVDHCIQSLKEILDKLIEGADFDYKTAAEEVSKQEHQADLTKQEILDHLPRALFMPVDRGKIVQILGFQDRIADLTEDIALLLTFKRLEIPEGFEEDFRLYVDKNLECFAHVKLVINELDQLIESAFGGPEVKKCVELADQVNFLEHEADEIEHRLMARLFDQEEQFSVGSFYLFCKVLSELGAISDTSESLADRVKEMILANK